MSAPVKSNDLRICLNKLDQLLAREGDRSEVRPIAAKVFEGDDAVFGSRT